MMRTSKNAGLALLSVLVLACGGGGSESSSGVNPQKALGDATSQEVDRLCTWFVDEVRVTPTDEQICEYEAVLNSESKAACEDLTQLCISEGPTSGDIDPSVCPFDEQNLAGCELAISIFEDCLRRSASNTRRVWNNVSCDRLSAEDLDLPSSCERILRRCPEVFAVDGDNSDGDTYICDDGKEIPADYFCDGFDDCRSGEDERCTSDDDDDDDDDFDDGSDGGFVCNDGSDIDDSYVCDDYRDCAFGEDELACGDDPTPPVQFECEDGKNIDMKFVCDGTRDCKSGEDEATCDGGFVCDDGFDITDQWKCDDRADCDGGEDELDC